MVHTLRAHGIDGVQVQSCGTAAYHIGEAADARTIAHAKKRGYDLRAHRARVVVDADFTTFDRIYAMDRQNLADLQRRCPDAHQHKLALLLGDADVLDPWSHGAEAFEHVLDVLVGACDALALRLRARR